MRAIKRENASGKDWKPNADSRVCSIHFPFNQRKKICLFQIYSLGTIKKLQNPEKTNKMQTSEFNTLKNNNCSLMKIQKSSDTGATDVTGETACVPVLEVASDKNILDDYYKNKESGCDVKSSNATQDSVCVNCKTFGKIEINNALLALQKCNAEFKILGCIH